MRKRPLFYAGICFAAGLASFAVASTPAEAEAQVYCGQSTGNVCQKIEWCIDAYVIKSCTSSYRYYAP